MPNLVAWVIRVQMREIGSLVVVLCGVGCLLVGLGRVLAYLLLSELQARERERSADGKTTDY